MTRGVSLSIARCHCDCGAYDPDCDHQRDPEGWNGESVASIQVTGCEGELNNGYARCAPPEERGDPEEGPSWCSPVPMGWDVERCAASLYNERYIVETDTGDSLGYGGSVVSASRDGAITCQCGCGAPDPDCKADVYDKVIAVGCGTEAEIGMTYTATDAVGGLVLNAECDFKGLAYCKKYPWNPCPPICVESEVGDHTWHTPFTLPTDSHIKTTSQMKQVYTCNPDDGSAKGTCVMSGAHTRATQPQPEGWNCDRREDGYSRFNEVGQTMQEWSCDGEDACPNFQVWLGGWQSVSGTVGPTCDVGCGLEDPDCAYLETDTHEGELLDGRSNTWDCDAEGVCTKDLWDKWGWGGHCKCDEIAFGHLWPAKHRGCSMESVAACVCGGDDANALELEKVRYATANYVGNNAGGPHGNGYLGEAGHAGFIVGISTESDNYPTSRRGHNAYHLERRGTLVAPISERYFECTASHSCKSFFTQFPWVLKTSVDPDDLGDCEITAAGDENGPTSGCTKIGNGKCEDAELYMCATTDMRAINRPDAYVGPHDIYHWFNATQPKCNGQRFYNTYMNYITAVRDSGALRDYEHVTPNSAKCMYDGGDCCAATNPMRTDGPNPTRATSTGGQQPSDDELKLQGLCIDPDNQRPTLESDRLGGWGVERNGVSPCPREVYTVDPAATSKRIDLCAQGVLKLPSATVDLAGNPLCLLPGSNDPRCMTRDFLVNYTGFPPAYVAEHTALLDPANIKYNVAGYPMGRNLPPLYANAVVKESTRPYEHDDFDDYHVDLAAGERIRLCVDAQDGEADSISHFTMELIAPDTDGTVADPRAEELYELKPVSDYGDTTTLVDFQNLMRGTLDKYGGQTDESSEEWTDERLAELAKLTGEPIEFLQKSGDWDNEFCVHDWHRENCRCYGTVCSCGTVTEGAEGAASEGYHCVPQPHAEYGNKPITNDHRVWLEPGVGGKTYRVTMNRWNSEHVWPMMLQVFGPRPTRMVNRDWQLYRNDTLNPQPMCRTTTAAGSAEHGYQHGEAAAPLTLPGTVAGKPTHLSPGKHGVLTMPVADDEDVYPLPEGDGTFGFDPDHVAECCWPYLLDKEFPQKNCARRANGVLGMDVLLGGTPGTRGEATLGFYATEPGWYTFAASSFGDKGGAYQMSVDETGEFNLELDKDTLSDVARTLNGMIQEQKCDKTDGAGGDCVQDIAYGETRLGVIEDIGETDVFRFEGALYDYVSLYAGPAYKPDSDSPQVPKGTVRQVEDSINWLCNFPYKMGFGCLDVQLALIAPSGRTELVADTSAYASFVGAAAVTRKHWNWPWATTTGFSDDAWTKSTYWMLEETGTYTVRVMGHASTNGHAGTQGNGRYRYPQLKPTGAYYVQLASAGARTVTALDRELGIDKAQPHCSLYGVPPEAKKGWQREDGTAPVKGCANFVYGGMYKTRHPQCEKFWPQGVDAILEHVERTGCINNWEVQETGRYTVRVRTSMKRSTFAGSGSTFEKPEGRAYRLTLGRSVEPMTDAVRGDAHPTVLKEVPQGVEEGTFIEDVYPVARDVAHRITHLHNDATLDDMNGFYGPKAIGLNEYEMPNECSQLAKFAVEGSAFSDPSMSPKKARTQALSFEVTKGERLCLKATDGKTVWDKTGIFSEENKANDISVRNLQWRTQWTKMEIFSEDDRLLYYVDRSMGTLPGEHAFTLLGDGTTLEVNGYTAPESGLFKVVLHSNMADTHPGNKCRDQFGRDTTSGNDCANAGPVMMHSARVNSTFDAGGNPLEAWCLHTEEGYDYSDASYFCRQGGFSCEPGDTDCAAANQKAFFGLPCRTPDGEDTRQCVGGVLVSPCKAWTTWSARCSDCSACLGPSWLDDTPLFGTFEVTQCDDVVDLGYDEVFTSQGLTDCDKWEEYLGIDRCMLLPGSDARVSEDLRSVTFESGREHVAMTRFSIPLKNGVEHLTASGPSYYFEVTADGPGLTQIGLVGRHMRRDKGVTGGADSFVWQVQESTYGSGKVRSGYCGTVGGREHGFCADRGAVIGVALDVGRMAMAFSVDGQWQPTREKGVNKQGTEFNRHPVKKCDVGDLYGKSTGWTCDPNLDANGHDSRIGFNEWDCCPYSDAYWTESEHKIGRSDTGMMCNDQLDRTAIVWDEDKGLLPVWMENFGQHPGYIGGGIAPSCAYSNPVNDAQCTVGPTGRTGAGADGEDWSLVTPLEMSSIKYMYEDPVIRHQDDEMAFRYFVGVGGKSGKSYTFNFGDDPSVPFAHEVPCGYQPLSNVINANVDSSAPFTLPATTNCWTCKGTCTDYDATPDGITWAERTGLPVEDWPTVPTDVTVGVGKCNRYADGSTTGAFDYKKHGMTGLKFSKDVLPAQNINQRPRSCESEMDRDCPNGPQYNTCQAWKDGTVLGVSAHYGMCREGSPANTGTRVGRKVTVDGVDHWVDGYYTCNIEATGYYTKSSACGDSKHVMGAHVPVSGTMYDCVGEYCPDEVYLDDGMKMNVRFTVDEVPDLLTPS